MNLSKKERRRLGDKYKKDTVETAVMRKTMNSSGNKLVNDYEFLEVLGKGSFGKVKVARDVRDDSYYAVKILSKPLLMKKRVGMTSNALDDVRTEISILKELSHPHIVRLFEVIDDVNFDKLFMFSEYVKNGAVMKGIEVQDPLPEDKAWKYFRDLVLGLEFLHSRGIVHRDIKPENLLVSEDDRLIITDFGVSLRLGPEDKIRRSAGSPAFLAPETCSGEEFTGPPVDIWAAGITLYVFTFGYCPFLADQPLQMYNVILNKPLHFDKEIDKDLEDLLKKLLDKNPKTRITLDVIREHPWVTKNGEQTLKSMEEAAIYPFEGSAGAGGRSRGSSGGTGLMGRFGKFLSIGKRDSVGEGGGDAGSK